MSTLTQQLCAPAAGLFRPAGPGGRQLYPVPGPCGAAELKRYKLLGLLMAKVGRHGAAYGTAAHGALHSVLHASAPHEPGHVSVRARLTRPGPRPPPCRRR